MAASAKLSGETLIVRHIPLAHGQSVGCQLYNTVQRPRRPCSLKLTHSLSLPEREIPPKEDFQSYSSKSSSNDEAGATDLGAEITRGYNSSPTFQLSSSQRRVDFTGSRGTVRWQNPFLPESEVHEDEEDEDDSDGDNLHKYCEGSSFQLQGNSDGTQDEAMGYAPDIWLPCSSQGMAGSPVCSHELKMLHLGMDLFGTPEEHKQIKGSDLGLQHRRDSKSTPTLMDCEEQEWEDEEGYAEYNTVQPKTSESELSNQKPIEYVSDSSCNSSDGVLVNFSAIYNKTNNAVPATPHDLDSPAKQPHGSASTSQDDDFNPLPCWSPCGLDPNCNIYPLDGLASFEVSDLTACLQSQARPMTSTQNYYKLVTCDLSSQSSLSPAWSSVTSCSEAHSQGSLTPPTEYFLFRQPEGEEGDVHEVDKRDTQTEEHSEPKRGKRIISDSTSRGAEPQSHDHSGTTQSRSWDGRPGCCSSAKQEALPRVPSCPSHINVDPLSRVPKQHITSFAELARCKKGGGDSSSLENSMEAPTCSKFTHHTSPIQRTAPVGRSSTVTTSQTHETCETLYQTEGACASSPTVMRYTKAQRPTFLPIQPFVLQPPSGNQHSKALGSLLNQFISHKHGKPSSSKSKGKCKGLTSLLRPSPLGSYSSMHLEATTSSDTCSTCSPSPVQPHGRTHWAHPSPLLFQNHPEPDQKQSSPNTLDFRLPVKSPSAVQACLDQSHPTADWTGLRETSPKPSLTMEPLEEPHPEQAPSLPPLFREELMAPKPGTQEQFVLANQSSSPAITSVTSLTSDTCLKLQKLWSPSYVADTSEELSTTSTLFGPRKLTGFSVKDKHSDSFSLTDRPPEEFCLSPDASSDFLSIHFLQKRGMLNTVGSAVDLITAHFSSGRDPEEKVRLGNSSLCPRIGQLVLDQLCPAIQSILEDGLKAFKLDLIVGQRRNKPWSVVEACTQPGPSTRILHSLVSVVGKCSQLNNHSMRVNAFFLGLLNLRSLESWFRHLYTSVDVVTAYYHHWSFLALSQGPACKSLFQELLLLLQPLNQLPFGLHLLSELRVQRRQAQKPSRSVALSSRPFLQMPSNQKKVGHPKRSKLKMERGVHSLSPNESRTSCGTHMTENLQRCAVGLCKQPELSPPEEKNKQKSVSLISSERECAGWWLGQTSITEGMMVSACSPHGQNEEHELAENSEKATEGLLQTSQQEKPQKELRWARLFGSGICTSVEAERAQQNNSQTQRTRLPSQWLKLGASKMDVLAQSIWGRDMGRALCQEEPRPKQRQ